MSVTGRSAAQPSDPADRQAAPRSIAPSPSARAVVDAHLDVLQPFDAVRAGVLASALALVDAHLRGDLEAILAEVVELTGFRVAAVARVRDDDHMQMIAEVGAGISPQQMEESAIPVGLWLASVGQSGDWGRWKFSSAADVPEEVLAHTWIPDLPAAVAEDDWDPRDELVCPIHDAQGRLAACLLLDVPHDGKLPGPDRHPHFNRVGAVASQAILATIEREEARQRLRLVEAVRSAAVVGATASLEQLTLTAVSAVEAGMVADRVGVVWFLPELISEQQAAAEAATPDRWTGRVVDRAQVLAWWARDEVGRFPARPEAGENPSDTLLIVPIGTDRTCLGALAIERTVTRATWTRAEVRGAREFAAELGQSAQEHLGRREEQLRVDELREMVAEHSRLGPASSTTWGHRWAPSAIISIF